MRVRKLSKLEPTFHLLKIGSLDSDTNFKVLIGLVPMGYQTLYHGR